MENLGAAHFLTGTNLAAEAAWLGFRVHVLVTHCKWLTVELHLVHGRMPHLQGFFFFFFLDWVTREWAASVSSGTLSCNMSHSSCVGRAWTPRAAWTPRDKGKCFAVFVHPSILPPKTLLLSRPPVLSALISSTWPINRLRRFSIRTNSSSWSSPLL